MAKKRVTLPKEFKDLMDEGNIEALKAVYDRCELTAHDGRFSLCTPLHMGGVPDELVIWLVEQGLDINIPDYYGATPLYRQATMGRETVKLLLKLGADIEKSNTYGNTPLHMAAEFFHPKTVALLIEKGANVNPKYEELWSFLIPSSGAAKTVQGEVIRIPGRVRGELDRNGGVNWDRDYRKMLQALPQYLSLGIPLSDQKLEETKELIAQVHGKDFDDEPRLDRLCQLAIAWIKQNPEPLLLEKTSYKR
ncbi:ankyrin repeat domain-containing protein [Streptococcus sp. SR1]|uniref:ankyrin repeat domain-containing protein n=1 Tax=Streptococcus sp. SR1 TaxID=1161416 RepID=UPI00044B91FD|nr:ankyrin repeat domain-containing protein [Streptococcus sp. SR1]EUC80039.1 ankyrin repeat protein [Streptococcus sp. SR1]